VNLLNFLSLDGERTEVRVPSPARGEGTVSKKRTKPKFTAQADYYT
jgi:hypothetical protein